MPELYGNIGYGIDEKKTNVGNLKDFNLEAGKYFAFNGQKDKV